MSEKEIGNTTNRCSAFDTVAALCERTRRLYQEDSIPWVVGYSGGKDSTAVLQIVWMALSEMPREELTKPVHVISTDTLVENPVVAEWVKVSLTAMSRAATEQGLPIRTHSTTKSTSGLRCIEATSGEVRHAASGKHQALPEGQRSACSVAAKDWAQAMECVVSLGFLHLPG